MKAFYGEDLRAHSQFHEALELDLAILPKFEMAFGVDHERTLDVRSNIAIDYRQLGRFREALEVDQRNLEDRRRILGPNDPITLHSQNAVARDLRSLGRYQESLDIARKVVRTRSSRPGPGEPRMAGCSAKGSRPRCARPGITGTRCRRGEHVLQRYRDYLGEEHMYTLRAAANLINARRAVGDLSGAEELARETRERCLGSRLPDDLLYAALLNLASVLRVAGTPR